MSSNIPLGQLRTLGSLTHMIKPMQSVQQTTQPASLVLNNIGAPWSKEEDKQLIKLYNEDKLDVIQISKLHGRAIGGILARLVKNHIIPNKMLARGYNLINQTNVSVEPLITPNQSEYDNDSKMITINDNEYIVSDNKVYSIKKIKGELCGYYDPTTNTIYNQELLDKIINWVKLNETKTLKMQFYGLDIEILQQYFQSYKLLKIYNGLVNKTEPINVCVFYKFLTGNSWSDELDKAIQLLPTGGDLIIIEQNENYQIIKDYLQIRGLSIDIDDYSPTNKLFCLTGIKKLPKLNKTIMFLDTETTGFSTSTNPKEIDKFDNARLIELGYLIYNKDNCKIKEVSSLVKPQNFIIKNTFVHGITTKQALTNGLEINTVLSQFYEDLKNTDTIICHNINFDMQILLSEAFRSGNTQLYDLIESKNKLCTMEIGKKYMKSTKNPKLVELYKYLYNKEVKQDHRSLSDCIICADCYYKMV